MYFKGLNEGLAKYLLFSFNFLIVVCAIIPVVFGALTLKDDGKLNKQAVTDFSVGVFAMAFGFIIFLIAFFGCCRAIKQNKWLLKTYAAILIVLLILQIVLPALAFVAINSNGNEFKKNIETIMTDYLNDVKEQNDIDAKEKEVLDSIKKYSKCSDSAGASD